MGGAATAACGDRVLPRRQGGGGGRAHLLQESVRRVRGGVDAAQGQEHHRHRQEGAQGVHTRGVPLRARRVRPPGGVPPRHRRAHPPPPPPPLPRTFSNDQMCFGLRPPGEVPPRHRRAPPWGATGS
eukprot:375051-Prorocentrum_minimum.AAC.1